MTDREMQSWELLIECVDMNQFSANSLIGSYNIGLATLYKQSNHEFYSRWIQLIDPSCKEPQGYLLISCYIIGTNDNPPVHQINEILHYDGGIDEVKFLILFNFFFTFQFIE